MRSHLKPVREFFGAYRATAVTPDLLRDYMAERRKQGREPGTINKELAGLKRAFSLAVEEGKLVNAPVFPEKFKEDNARQGFFERTDFDAVLAHIGDSDVRDFLEFFYWTGMRPGEIRSLCWAAFDRESWTLRLHASDAKIGKGRVIAAEGPLGEILQRRMKARRFDCELIFHQDGKSLPKFYKLWKAACEKAGVTGRIVYDLRRTAVRNLVRAGVSEKVAMAISGHRTRAVFDRYNIVDEKDLRDAVLKVAAYVENRPSKEPAEVIAMAQGEHGQKR